MTFKTDTEIWAELRKKYTLKYLAEVSSGTACGCANCVKAIIEKGSVNNGRRKKD